MEFTRTFNIEDVSVRSAGGGRTVEAYATVFNTPAIVHDQDGDYFEVIDPAAFNRTIANAKRAKGGWNIPVMFNHARTIYGTPSDMDSLPIGVTEDIYADSKGLFTRARYHDTPRANDVLEAIREKSITAYSFSGAFKRSDPAVPRGRGFRADAAGNLPTVRRTESTLREFGPATFPVYSGAEVVGVRAEQAALILSRLAPGEIDRLLDLLASSTRSDDPLDDGTPDDSGLATEDPPQEALRSATPKELLMARYAEFIIQTRSA